MQHFLQAMAAVCLAGVAFVLPQSAQAADSCNTTVIDNTSQHVLDMSKVNAATQKLVNLGADVRVRAFQKVPDGSLQAYQASQVKSCASWRGPNGETEDNLVTFMFSISDRQSVIYYGSNWHGGLDNNWNRIRTDYMNAQFKLGKFTDGIVNAENETYRVLNNQLHPSQVHQSSSSSASSGAGKVLGDIFLALLVLAALAGATFGLVFLRKRHMRLVAENHSAQQYATEVRDKASTTVGALDMTGVKLSYDTVLTDLNDTDKAALADLLQHAESDYAAAINAESNMSDKAETYDPKPNRRTEEYQNITAHSNDVIQLAAAAASSIKLLDDQCAKLLREIAEAPQHLASLETEYARLMQVQGQLTSDGYKHDEDKVLAKVRKLLDEAKRQIDAKHHGQALDELTKSDELCSEVNDKLVWLGGIRKDLTDHSAKSKLVLQAVTTDVATGSTALDQLRGTYHQSCWQDLDKAEVDAKDALSTASDSLVDADKASSMELQQWSVAEGGLDDADHFLAKASKFRSMVDTRRQDLDKLQQELLPELQSLQMSIESAETKIGSLRGHHGKRLTQLTQYAAEANQLQQQLRAAKPAFTDIATAIEDMQKKVDGLLQKAQAEHDRIIADERRRRQEEEEAERRRNSYNSNNSFATGMAVGSTFDNSGGFGGFGGGGGFDSGGGGGGGFGGDSGGGGGGGY